MSFIHHTRIAVLAMGFLTTSCDVHTPTGSGSLQRIVVSTAPTLMVGATHQFEATGEDANGRPVAITPFWSIAAGGGTITSTGMFTAGLVPGVYPATVTATSGGVSGTATVTIVVGEARTLRITPDTGRIAIGGTQQFTAVTTDAGGNVVPNTAVVWTIGAGGGTLSTTGLFTAGAVPGTFANTVRATSGTLTASATVVVAAGALASITVTPNPDTLALGGARQFTAVGRDANGNVIPITPVWSVENTGGTIAGNGLFTAGNVSGTFTNTVRATSGTLTGSATIVVRPGALATITVLPHPVTLSTNATQQFSAIARDANGNVITMTPVWTVVNGGGTITSTGLFTAAAAAGVHTNTVVATNGALTGSATVTVTATPAPTSVVPLGAAGANGIMAGASVTCVTGGTINADVSISPGNTITGFGPCVITGTQHLANATALAGQTALTTAYNTAAGLPCPPANAIVANLGGTTKAAGVYCTASGISVSGTLTLDGGGDPNAVFVFQAGTSLTTAGNIVLINGAQAKNVFWVVGSSATLGTGSQWQGTIMALTSITLVDNATLFGRALARNGSVTLGTNNVIILP